MTTEYTTDEVRELFLNHVRHLVDYWATVEPAKNMRAEPYTCHDRVSGVAFSILVLLDGGTFLPGFIVAPDPHEDDKDFHKAREERWFPENNEPNVNCDIAGYLHELFHKREEVE